MAVTFTQLAAISTSTSNTNSYAGNAGTPASGDLLLCFVHATATVAAGTMTGTWTWQKYTSFTLNSGADTMYVFWAIATAATSTTPTFDCTGDNATSASIYCLRVAGDSLVERPFIRQIATATGTSANPAVAMARAILTGSGVCGFAANGTSNATQWTAPGSWSENAEVAETLPNGSMEVASRGSGETGSTITWTNSNTTAWGALVMEIAVADSVPPEFSEDHDANGPAVSLITRSVLRRLAAAVSETNPTLLTLAAPSTDILRPRTGSIFQRLRRFGTIAAQTVPNLLVTTLAVTVSIPQFTTEAAAQPRPRRAPQSDVAPNLFGTTLFPYVQKPFTNDETPQLIRRRAPAWDIARNLLILTTPIPTPPVQQETQPANLRQRRGLPPEVRSNLLTTTLAAAPPADIISPRSQISRAAPRRVGARSDEPQNLLTSTLAVTAQDPFKPGDPRQLSRRSQREQPFDIERNLVRLTTAVPNPPVQVETPIFPRPARRAPQEPVRPSLLATTLAAAPPADTIVPRFHLQPHRIKRPRPAIQEPTRSNPLTVPGYEVLGVGSTQIDSGVIPNKRRDARLAYRDDETRNLLTSSLFVPQAPDPAVGTIIVDSNVTRFRYRVGRDPEVQSRIQLLTAPVINPSVRPELRHQRLPRRRAIQEPEAPNFVLTVPTNFIIRLASFGRTVPQPKVGRLTEPDRSLALVTAPIINPPVQVETPLPVRPKPTWRDPQVQSRVTLLSAPIPIPNVQVEIPLPVRPKPTWRDPEHQSRIALLTAIAPLPKIQVEDPPSVRSRKGPQEHISPNLLGTTLAAPVVEVVNVRGKVSAAARRVRRPVSEETQNRTILLPVVVNPQVQVETPQVPTRTRYKPSDETYRPAPVSVADAFVQSEVDPPVRRRKAPQDPQHQSRIALLTAVAPLPKVQQETPLFPPVRPAKLDLEIQSMLALLSASLPFPNVQVELALPVRPKRAFQDPERQNLSLLPIESRPNVQVEIPLPVRPNKAWRDPEQQNRIPLLLSAIPEFQVEDPLFPTPKRAWIDPEHQSRISLLTAIAPLPKVVVDTSVPPRRIHAVWIPDQFNVPILELIQNAYRPDIELTLTINRSVDWTLEINRTVEQGTEINRSTNQSLDLTGE